MSIPCLSILMSTPDSRLWRAGQWLRSSEVRRQAESCFSNFQASGKLSKRAEIQKQLWPRSQSNKKNVPHESIGWSGCLCLLLPKQSRINKQVLRRCSFERHLRLMWCISLYISHTNYRLHCIVFRSMSRANKTKYFRLRLYDEVS